MKKVLVVENNPTILKLITHHLEAKNCDVHTAEDGLAALMYLDSEIPDIIFTDIIMPKVSGDQLCAIVRRDKRLQHIFIAVHSSTSIEDNRQILSLDADVYIAKGPSVNIRGHVEHVLRQFELDIRRDQTIIGAENLHPREITRELLLARKHYQAIFNNVSEAVIELDSSGQIVQINLAAQKLFAKSPIQILSSKFIQFIDDSDKTEVVDWFEKVDKGESTQFQSSYERPLLVNGRKILLKMEAIPEWEDYFIIAILQDITVQKQTEEKLARTIDEFNAVIDNIDYGILLMDENLQSRIVNQAYKDMWSIPDSFIKSRPAMDELMNYNRDTGIYDVPIEEMDRYVAKRVADVRKGDLSPRELKLTGKRVFQFQCVELPDNGRLLTYFDISGLKRAEKQLEEALEKVSTLANHDPLTGLPNLRLARERLHSAIALSKRKEWMAAIMFIDLDGFKEVNDSYGHDVGDEILQQVAKRLVTSLRETDTVARIGGDEFLLIQTEVTHRFAAANVAEKIVTNLSKPFFHEKIEINIGASIGISIYPEHGTESRILIKKADDAMYYTKRIGKNNYSFTPG